MDAQCDCCFTEGCAAPVVVRVGCLLGVVDGGEVAALGGAYPLLHHVCAPHQLCAKAPALPRRAPHVRH